MELIGRSCKYCRWRDKEKILTGIIHICTIDKRETKLDGYCPYFRLVKNSGKEGDNLVLRSIKKGE